MMFRHKLRVLFAYAQALLLMTIIGSGMLFMHKHQTSTGEIVIHVHPYNLKTDPDATKHHQTEDEIHFLDVVFSGSYLHLEWVGFEAIAPKLIEEEKSAYTDYIPLLTEHQFNSKRGPPLC